MFLNLFCSFVVSSFAFLHLQLRLLQSCYSAALSSVFEVKGSIVIGRSRHSFLVTHDCFAVMYEVINPTNLSLTDIFPGLLQSVRVGERLPPLGHSSCEVGEAV